MKPIPVNPKVTSTGLNVEPAVRCLVKTMTVLLIGLSMATGMPISAELWAQETELVDRIVAVVNNDIITLFDLNRAFAPYVRNIRALQYPAEKERQTLFKVRQDILNQLIDSMLADQQIKRGRITISEKEINKTIERFKESRQLTDEQLRLGLESQGMSMEDYRQEIKDQILRAKLVNREVKAKIVITKEDISKYYENHREKYAGEKKYYLWNMYIKVPAGSGSLERNSARGQMEAMRSRLKQGQSFISLVDELKRSPSIVQGTDLGFFSLADLAAQLQQVVEKMNPGDYSGVLETNFGYQIIYVQKVEESQAKPLESVEAEIEQILFKEMVDNKYQQWLEQLRAKSHIRIIN